MKHSFFLIVNLIAFSLFAQTEKGATPISDVPRAESRGTLGTTRAVIVGISDYQDEDIPDLSFAHKDAEAFAAYLQSPAGGAVPNENIILLQNKKATNARIADALIWLLEESKPGDQAVIYFSGHGDVETITRFNRGYLLTYDSPPKIYMAGAFNIRDLQDIISTLSDNEVQVVMISDACRAGKLAGAEVGGTEATAQNLSKQFAGEIKIMSCQPNEFSLEGEQWGGGRGAFSYHLLDGLYGLADKNGDAQVNLFEIGRYLEDRVPEETAPHNQMPFTVGDRNAQLAAVNAESLAQLKTRKASEQPQFAKIETKGMEQLILANADTSTQKMYADFTVALADKQLLEPAGKSAYDLYQVLSKKEEIKELHNIMRRNLSVALQEDAQQAVNAYLAANPTELQRRFENEEDYNLYPRYLEKATELLGEEHFYYKNLMAKRLYFEGLGLRLAAGKEDETVRDSTYEIALQKQLKALEYQERAPYVLNELGALHILLKQDSTALTYLDRAIEISPDWGLPYVNYSVGLFYSDKIEEAIAYGEEAAERLPNFPKVYSFLAWINANNWLYFDRKKRVRKGIELKDDYLYETVEYNSPEQAKQLYSRSIVLLEKAITMDSSYAHAYQSLSRLSFLLGEHEKALAYQLKLVQLEPENAWAYLRLGDCFRNLEKLNEAEQAYFKSIALDASNPTVYNNLSVTYRYWGKYDKAIEAGKKAIDLGQKFFHPYANIGNAYFLKKQFKESEYYLIKGIQAQKNHPQPYLQLGNRYLEKRRYSDAEIILLMAIQLKPDYVFVQHNLTTLYLETKQYKKGLDRAQKLIELEPNNLTYLTYLELIYFHLGDLKKAELYSDKMDALQKTGSGYFNIPDDYDFELDFGDYDISCHYADMGKSDQAIMWLSKGLEKEKIPFNKIYSSAELASIRDEPAFKALMEKHFQGRVYDGKLPTAENSEPIYYPDNCLLLADFYESEGEHERAKFLREKAAELKGVEEKE